MLFQPDDLWYADFGQLELLVDFFLKMNDVLTSVLVGDLQLFQDGISSLDLFGEVDGIVHDVPILCGERPPLLVRDS